jgi:ADP-heptose:LPS heptosyltransferase
LGPQVVNLAIFKVNQLGDNVVFLPVLQHLRKTFPSWKITVLTSPLAAPLYSNDLLPENIWQFPLHEFNALWKSPLRLAALLRRLRDFSADASILGDDQGNAAHLLARLAGGSLRIGVRRPFVKIPGSLTHALEITKDLPFACLHWNLGKTLLETAGCEIPWPKTPPAPNLSHLIEPDKKSPRPVVIHAGASVSYKTWFHDRAIELAIRLAKKAPVVWVFQKNMPPPPPCLNLSVQETPTLKALVTLLANASFFIGNNSGPMNLASALGIPSLIFNGPSARSWDPFWHREKIRMLRHEALPCLPCDQLHFAHFRCTNAQEPMACMNFWTVDKAYDEVVLWMDKWLEPL